MGYDSYDVLLSRVIVLGLSWSEVAGAGCQCCARLSSLCLFASKPCLAHD